MEKSIFINYRKQEHLHLGIPSLNKVVIFTVLLIIQCMTKVDCNILLTHFWPMRSQGIFRGYKMGTLARNGFILTLFKLEILKILDDKITLKNSPSSIFDLQWLWSWSVAWASESNNSIVFACFAEMMTSLFFFKQVTKIQGTILDYYQIDHYLKESTHISENYRSCIDLLFTSQPNLVVDFGIHPSLHENCHNQIIYSKFDLKIFYPPPYERTVWHYQQADTAFIERSLENFAWQNALLSETVIQMSKYLHWLLWVTLYRKKLYCLMTAIRPGL